MNRETRDKLVSGTDQADLTTGNACWETPPRVYAELDSQFCFDVDLTADAQRALCSVWFGPGGRHPDALTASWADNGRVGYSNPPYGPFIQKLLPKAKEEAKRGFTSVLLLPLRVTKAFKAHILTGAARLLFCDARLTFFESGAPRLNEKQFQKGKFVGDPAVFDSIIVVYQPGVYLTPTIDIWAVPPHVTREDLERAAERKRLAAA